MSNSRTPHNFIITFANQKGGVGKSTLCALFAHYLVTLGVKVRVIDADKQSSIAQLRSYNQQSLMEHDDDADMEIIEAATQRKYVDKRYQSILPQQTPWEIEPLSLESADMVVKHLNIVKEFDGIILIDSPGSLTQNGLVPLMVMSDFIFVPFFYDMPTILATAKFLVFVDKLRKRYEQEMGARLMLIPNRYRASVGTKEEKERIQQTIWTLKEFGDVAPDLKDTGRIQYFTTTGFNPIQKDACKNTFNFLLNESGIAKILELKLPE